MTRMALMTLWYHLRSLINPPRSGQDFWRRPNWWNRPEAYLASGQARSQFLVDLLKETDTTPNELILELGCNVGRNLHALYEAGFHSLVGVEINANAIELLRRQFPILVRDSSLMVGAMEEILPLLGSRQFQVIVTMAVLEHLPITSESVFVHMVRLLKTDGTLITIEDEVSQTARHFPRNYQKIFEKLGCVQVACTCCSTIQGLDARFVARVFNKG